MHSRDLPEIDYDEIKPTSTVLSEGSYSSNSVILATFKNQSVALKIVKLSRRNEGKQEVAILKALSGKSHPNIVNCIGYSFSFPLFIAYEFMPKGSLAKCITNNEINSAPIKMKIAIGLTQGTWYLHRNNIIHCDIKTDNVLMDEELNPKITDFGLSCFMPGDPAANCGSLFFAAPEIFNHYPNSAASDIHSLACTVWCVFSERLPYETLHKFPDKLASYVRTGGRETIDNNWPDTIKKYLEKGWRHQPSERATAGELLSLLEQAPITSRNKFLSSLSMWRTMHHNTAKEGYAPLDNLNQRYSKKI